MRYTIVGRNIEVTPGLKKAVEEKIGKLDRYFTPDTEVNVTMSVQRERQSIEVTIPIKEPSSAQKNQQRHVCFHRSGRRNHRRQILKYKRKLVDRKQSAPAFSEAFRNEETPSRKTRSRS